MYDLLLVYVPRVHGIDVSLGGMPQIDKELHRTRPTALSGPFKRNQNEDFHPYPNRPTRQA